MSEKRWIYAGLLGMFVAQVLPWLLVAGFVAKWLWDHVSVQW